MCVWGGGGGGGGGGAGSGTANSISAADKGTGYWFTDMCLRSKKPTIRPRVVVVLRLG